RARVYHSRGLHLHKLLQYRFNSCIILEKSAGVERYEETFLQKMVVYSNRRVSRHGWTRCIDWRRNNERRGSNRSQQQTERKATSRKGNSKRNRKRNKRK